MNIIDRLKTLKELKPDKEWSLLTMTEIMKTEIAQEGVQLTLLQKVKIFVNMHNNVFKTLAVSTVATTAVLVLGLTAFMQFTQPEQNNLLLDNKTQAEINSILAETKRINSAIKVEVSENRVTEQNEVLMDLLDQRHASRLALQSIISKEIGNIKTRHREKLTDQDKELLLLALKSNQAEDFHLALFVLKNIRD